MFKFTISGPEVLFKTCVAMKFVDDDDDDYGEYSNLKRRREVWFIARCMACPRCGLSIRILSASVRLSVRLYKL